MDGSAKAIHPILTDDEFIIILVQATLLRRPRYTSHILHIICTGGFPCVCYPAQFIGAEGMCVSICIRGKAIGFD